MVTDMQEAVRELKRLNDEGNWNQYFIGLCFDVIRDHPDDLQKCWAAVLLSKIVNRDLAVRTRQFLEQHQSLPERVHEVLEASILRMAGY